LTRKKRNSKPKPKGQFETKNEEKIEKNKEDNPSNQKQIKTSEIFDSTLLELKGAIQSSKLLETETEGESIFSDDFDLNIDKFSVEDIDNEQIKALRLALDSITNTQNRGFFFFFFFFLLLLLVFVWLFHFLTLFFFLH